MKSSIKKVVAGLSVAAMLASAMQVVSAWYFEDETISDFKIRENNAGILIEEYVGPTKDKIVIPEKLENEDGEVRDVVGVLDYAFAKVADDTTIYIPKTVNDIRSQAFVTAGSLDKVLVEGLKKDEAMSNPTAADLTTYWGTKVINAVSNQDPQKLLSEKIAKVVNNKIGGVDKIKNIGATIGTELNKIMDGIKVPTDEELTIPVPDFSSLKTVDVTVDPKFIQKIPGIDGSVTEVVAWSDAVKTDIKTRVETQINNELNAKLYDEETGLFAEIDAQKAKIPDVKDMKEDIERQVKETVDTMLADFKPMLDIVDDVEGTVNGYIDTYKASAMNVLADLPIKGSASQTAVEVLKSIDGFGDEVYRIKIAENYKKVAAKLGLNANVDVTAKLRTAVEKLVSNYPYYGVSIIGEEVEEGEISYAKLFADEKKIDFEFGEPEEPKKEVVTQIVTEEPKIEYVDGGTQIVTGTTKIIYVDSPKETVTSIVTVPVEVEVTKIVTETVIVEKPIYITESTTPAPTYLKGDVNQNGKIDLRDVIWIAENMIDKREFSDLEKEIGDMNNNGKIDLHDAIAIATIMVQK